MNAPVQPQVSGDAMYCSGESLFLTAPVYPGDSVLYIWHTPVGDIEIWNDNTLTIDDLMGVNSGSYSVIVQIDDCDSRESEALVVIVSQVVSTPVVTGPATVCTGDTMFLSTQTISGGMYNWTGPGGFSSQIQNPKIFPATALTSGI
jgi:hypothetical protein